VTVSVRPEKLTLADSASPAAGGNRLEGVVDVVTFLGAIVRAEVTVAGRTFFVDVPHAAAHVVARRQRLTLAFAPADCVVLTDGEGGPYR
jgi:ABC-type Fe3+/spermidine/putrescine transport system ATPase subunit